MTKCIYPDWEGGHIEDKHIWDKDGFCNVCGEKNMTEHVHEWQLITDWWRKTNWFRCRGCGAEIEIDRAEARLNEYETLKKATERLSAEDASWCADVLMEATNKHGVGQKFNRNPYYLADVLKAYAAILEGK